MELIPYPIIKPDNNPSVVIIHAREKSTSGKKKKKSLSNAAAHRSADSWSCYYWSEYFH